jgi:ankyrin repeat protein
MGKFNKWRTFTSVLILAILASCAHKIERPAPPSIDIAYVQAQLQAGVKPDDMPIQESTYSTDSSLLCQACRSGQMDVVRLLVENHGNLKPLSNYSNDYSNSPLAIAVNHNHYEIAEFLLKNGADPNCEIRTDTIFYRSALAEALFDKNRKMAALLRKYGANVNSDLHNIGYFSPEQVEIILKEGVKNVSLGFFRLPSPYEVGLIEVEKIIKLLKKYGGDINEILDSREEGIHTPLTYVVEKGYDVRVAELLIKHGANMEKGSWGLQTATPLFMAAALGDFEMVKMLVEHGACIEGANYWCITPLSAAASCGRVTHSIRIPSDGAYFKIVKFLIEHGANVNGEYEENYGSTPLTWAVGSNCKEIVEILVEHGAKIHWTKKGEFDSDPPIYIARKKKFKEIQQILEKALHKKLNPYN